MIFIQCGLFFYSMRIINTALIFLGLVSSAFLTLAFWNLSATGPIFAEATEIFAFEGSISAAFVMVACKLFMHQEG